MKASIGNIALDWLYQECETFQKSMCLWTMRYFLWYQTQMHPKRTVAQWWAGCGGEHQGPMMQQSPSPPEKSLGGAVLELLWDAAFWRPWLAWTLQWRRRLRRYTLVPALGQVVAVTSLGPWPLPARHITLWRGQTPWGWWTEWHPHLPAPLACHFASARCEYHQGWA